MSEKGFQTGHVGLNVKDLSRSLEFYLEVFGFENRGESREKGREFAMLSIGGKLVLTLWQQSSDGFGKNTAGLHHLSFEAESIEKIREYEEKLRKLGAKFIYEGIVPHAEGAKSGGIFFEDPDGIRLEIYVAAGAEEYEAPTKGAPACGFF
jgi:catechol-2,3-dioxygenase